MREEVAAAIAGTVPVPGEVCHRRETHVLSRNNSVKMGSARASRALFRALAEQVSAPEPSPFSDRDAFHRPARAPDGTREARVLPKREVSYGRRCREIAPLPAGRWQHA